MAKKKVEDGAVPEIAADPADIQEIAEVTPESLKGDTEPQKGEIEALKAEVGDLKDKYLRLAVEYDNFRKRSQKERETLYADALANTAAQFLPVYDNLERALNTQTEDQAYYKGVCMIMSQFNDVLERLGISRIQADGTEFDPNFHNAVTHTEDENLGNNVVAEVFQQGFVLNERILRHATVKVANIQ